MAQKLTIEFQATGDKALIAAIKQMDVVTKHLQGQTSRYEKELKKLGIQQGKVNNETVLGVKNQRLLGNTFATIRSKILLASFAMGLFAKSLGKLGSLYGFQEAAEKRLSIALGGNIDLLKAYATQVQKNTAFGDEEVITAMALIANYTTEERVVKQLMDATLDLAAAKGKNLSEAAELVSKSVFSTTNALQREGVSVEGVSGSVERLTSLTGNLAALYGGQAQAATETYDGAIKDLQDSLGDLGENLGEVLVPALKLSASLLQTLAEHFDVERIKTYSTAIIGLGSTYLYLSGAVATAGAATLTFVKSNWKVLAALTAVAAVGELLARFTNSFEGDVVDLEAELDDLNKTIGNMGAKIDVGSTALQSWNRHLNHNISLIKERYAEQKTSASIEEKLEILEARRLAIMEKQEQKLGNVIDLETELNNVEAEIFNAEQERVARRLEFIDQVMNATISFAEAEIESERAYAEAKIAIIDKTDKKELDALKSTWLYKKMTDKQKAASEKEITDEFIKQRQKLRDDANKDIERAFKATQTLKASQAIMNIAEQITESLGKPWKIAFIAAMGAIQLATIKAEKPPKMQYGGLVGGRRHSSGGTMLEAEQGEFVVSRAGVEATGIEALNRINAGTRGAGGTSIVINNPILGKDMIEDEIVPQIQEALRRGGSIN